MAAPRTSSYRPPTTPRGPRVRPLLARPGARFACHGDGLCCTDAHALGPITPSERQQIERFRAGATVYLPMLDAHSLASKDDGSCVFLGPGARCEIHTAHGPEAKSDTCRRFPYGLVATPDGGRVTTEHRCPCRTLGQRPPLDLADAQRALTASKTRLVADARVGPRVRMTTHRRVSWETYREAETAMFARLAHGERLEAVLDALPLRPVRTGEWTDVAHLLRSHVDGTACGEALALAGEVLLALAGAPARRRFALRARPWATSFDRAEQRTTTPGAGEDVLRDYVEDQLWRMEWCASGATFAQARAELATRVAMAREVARRLRVAGVRADRAMAEAVFVIELTAATSIWENVLHQIAP
jgi:hypothetical protein